MDDPDLAARAVLGAGAYEQLFDRHLQAPPAEGFAPHADGRVPNFSLRMHAVTAAMLRPQIGTLEARIAEYNRRGSLAPATLEAFVAGCKARGAPVEIFGAADNARNFQNWRCAAPAAGCERSLRILQYAADLRLPLTFDQADLDTAVDVVLFALDEALALQAEEGPPAAR